jgi:hypothetical protein
VNGTNQFDVATSEVFLAAPGTTVAGVKTFKTVTSASKSLVGASATPASIGISNKIGVALQIVDGAAMLFADNAAIPATLDLVNNSFLPSQVPDGALSYALIANI